MTRPAKIREQSPPAPAALPFALMVVATGGGLLAWNLTRGEGLTFSVVLLALGLLLLWRVLRRRSATRAWGGARFECSPSPVVAGRAFRVRVLLPRASAVDGPLTLRVVQRRVDASNSSHESSLEWEQTQTVSPVPRPDGQHQVEAGFQLPADAPASGMYRGQCIVQWRVQLVDAQGLARQSFEVPVRADRASAAASPLGEPLFAEQPIDELPGGQLQLSPSWQELEDAGGFTWRFRRPVLRMLGLLSALAALSIVVVLAQAHGLRPAAWRIPIDELLLCVWVVLLVPAAVHALTARWWLRVDDNGLAVDRSSWLRPRRLNLGALPLDQVSRMSVAVAGPASADRAWYRLIATLPDGARHWLTPRMRGPGLAQELSRRLHVAYRQRGARFAPGGQRRQAALWPWGLALLLWGAWIVAVAVAFSDGVTLVS